MNKTVLSTLLIFAIIGTATLATQPAANAATYILPTGPLTPPTLTIESPEATTYVSWFVALRFSVQGNWDGYVNRCAIRYVIDSELPVIAFASPFPINAINKHFQLTLGPLSEGTHQLQIFATVGGAYRVGQNSSSIASGDFTSTQSVSFTVDTTNQAQILILSPTDQVYSENKSIPVEFTLSKPTAIESMGYTLDGQPNVTIPRNTTLYGPLSDGLHTLKVFAVYSDVAPAYSIVNFTVDTTAPKVSIISLEDKIYNSTDVPLVFAVNETTSQITYILDKEVYTIYGNSTLVGLQDGDHELIVYATDEAGNAAPSEPIEFKVQVPLPPETAYGVLPPMVIVLVGGFSCLIYIERRKQNAEKKD